MSPNTMQPFDKKEHKNKTACTECGFKLNCLCHLRPKLSVNVNNTCHTAPLSVPPIELALLTHENEFNRATNTGKLLQQTLDNCVTYSWSRVNPPTNLIAKIERENTQTYLLYPSENSPTIDYILTTVNKKSSDTPQNHSDRIIFIILDGTWQEAKKMLNKSDWLKSIPKIALSAQAISQYNLRRNQSEGNLCTCEVGIEILKACQFSKQANALHSYFEFYLKAFNAEKIGHQLDRPTL